MSLRTTSAASSPARDVVDTHFINRSTFKVEAQPPPGDHQALGVVYATWLQYPGTILLIGTALAMWLLAFRRAGARRER